jgi:large subunit ribosomal protein L46
MNTWVVSNHPIAHVEAPYSPEEGKVNGQGTPLKSDMIFFMKARIMAGQANIEKNELGIQDYKWLTKDEIQPLVAPHMWASLKNFLPQL